MKKPSDQFRRFYLLFENLCNLLFWHATCSHLFNNALFSFFDSRLLTLREVRLFSPHSHLSNFEPASQLSQTKLQSKKLDFPPLHLHNCPRFWGIAWGLPAASRFLALSSAFRFQHFTVYAQIPLHTPKNWHFDAYFRRRAKLDAGILGCVVKSYKLWSGRKPLKFQWFASFFKIM